MSDESASGEDEGDAEVPWGTVVLGGGALFACLPAILGGLGSIIPELLWPGDRWPVETGFQRAVVSFWTWSVMLSMMSLPGTVLGIILGSWAIKRAGWKTAFGKAVALVLALAVVSTGAHVINMQAALRKVQERGGWPSPRPR